MILEAGIPGDVRWSLIYVKQIVFVPHHDGLFVDIVNDDLDGKIDGMTASFGMWLKEVILTALQG